jgi:hypothetical protein
MDEEELNKLKKELDSAYSSPMQAVMAQLHEMYISFKRAGFTRREALLLVSRLFNEMTLGGMDSDKRD